MDAQGELERDPLVAQYVRGVAHRLKQPLAVAWGFLELLAEDPTRDLTPSAERYVHEIQSSLQTMNEVLDELL